MIWYSHLLQNFQQFIVSHTVEGFGIVNKAEIDVFLELSCFFDDPVDVGNLISGSSAFSKARLNIWKFMVSFLPLSHLGSPRYVYTYKYNIYSQTDVYVFLELSCFFDDPVDVSNLISDSLPFLNPA